MNIIQNTESKWKASIRSCGTEFGGDHHLYVDFLDVDGKDCRDEKTIVVDRGSSLVAYAANKPLGEPAINIPIWRGENLTVSVYGDSDVVEKITTSRAEDGVLYHQSFYLVFQERSARPAEPVAVRPSEPTGDKEAERQAILSMLQQAMELVKSL